jgi:hypothetical protein
LADFATPFSSRQSRNRSERENSARGAAAFSAALSGAHNPKSGERVAVIISGGNTTAVDFGPESLHMADAHLGRLEIVDLTFRCNGMTSSAQLS